MAEEKEVTCLHCFAGILEIKVQLEMLNKTSLKMMMAMLGIIAATVGAEFLGTPWYVHVSQYAGLFAGVFLFSSVVFMWKRLSYKRILLRLVFSLMLFYSIGTRTFIFENRMDVFPSWFPVGINIFYIFIAILLVYKVWNHKIIR